jgi:hypothetical protein
MPAFFTSISAPVFLKQLWGQKNHNFEKKRGGVAPGREEIGGNVARRK